MLQAAKFQRMYILLRPCAHGGGGYARLEQARGKYTLTVNAQGFTPSEEGVRVLLAAKDDSGGAAVCDLGLLPISSKGQSTLRREISATPGGIPLNAYSALCIAKDWPAPKLLLLGSLEENDNVSSYLIGQMVCRYLSVPAKLNSQNNEPEETSSKPSAISLAAMPTPNIGTSSTPSAISALPEVESTPADMVLPNISPTYSAISQPQKFHKPAEPETFLKEILPFPLAQAGAIAKPASALSTAQSPASPSAADPQTEKLDPAVFTSATERPLLPPDFPVSGTPQGRPPVGALPKLQWPTAVKELERYFSTYPPYAPFDAPGWRFVQVPMASGSTIPYYAVGMLARDGKVVQVAYAVPGERGGMPPAGFSGYRWQQGRNGQGYWTLWKRA